MNERTGQAELSCNPILPLAAVLEHADSGRAKRFLPKTVPLQQHLAAICGSAERLGDDRYYCRQRSLLQVKRGIAGTRGVASPAFQACCTESVLWRWASVARLGRM